MGRISSATFHPMFHSRTLVPGRVIRESDIEADLVAAGGETRTHLLAHLVRPSPRNHHNGPRSDRAGFGQMPRYEMAVSE
ncbi:hypothetical protein AAFF_G00072590 [Aldrovandia affinis]|uniref:Uncharacterized protein n=1 Tax=Aldrovandia affinis TaxID=143900 RepID=A0AAD7WDP1_9TELE|nr:hypothetical protein AAFF_G00072590 [Aldrovandia affinis]